MSSHRTLVSNPPHSHQTNTSSSTCISSLQLTSGHAGQAHGVVLAIGRIWFVIPGLITTEFYYICLWHFAITDRMSVYFLQMNIYNCSIVSPSFNVKYLESVCIRTEKSESYQLWISLALSKIWIRNLIPAIPKISPIKEVINVRCLFFSKKVKPCKLLVS